MRRMLAVAAICVGLVVSSVAISHAANFTPLEWQQTVARHVVSGTPGQRKNVSWIRDRNRNFIDDLIEARFEPGEIVDVVVDLNTCLTPAEIRTRFSRYGTVTYIGKLVSFLLLNAVPVDSLSNLAARPDVAMVEWQVMGQVMNDVSTRTIQARASVTFTPNTAQDAGFTGTGVNVGILDTGVDDGTGRHEAFPAGRFVAGFNALRFEDTNGNGIDDSCEPAPLGNGSCANADDEPGNGTTNPADDHSHGTHVAGSALGGGTAGRVCSTPDDASATACGGVAPGAGLVDIKICNSGGGCTQADVAEALDWVAINRATFNIQVINMSIGFCTDDDGTSAMAQQVNYVVSLGVVAVVALGNAGNCGLAAGTMRTMFPASSSFAITVAGTNDQNTMSRADDTNFSGFLRGPRNDFNLITPDLLALKPDLAAPGQNIVSAQFNTTSSYFSQSGTSMASPHVAGAAALIRQAQPTMDPGSLKDLLKRSADASQNVAQFAAVDPAWDNDLGAGMLDVWPAVSSAATTDVGFVTCSGPPSSPGQPCTLPSPMPSWNNTADISTATSPQVGVANTISAQVRNVGAATATVLVNFGVYIFAVGNNQFFHVGTQQVTIPGNTTVTVSQAWTPAAANHQCVQISIDFGFDSNFDNNVTQRNLQVAPSVYDVRVENPFLRPARFEIRAKSDRHGWVPRVSEQAFSLDPFRDCPRNIRVTFDPPAGARPGERANCDLAVYATPRGSTRAQLIGGVTMQTFVPRPCRVVGSVIDGKGNPVPGATLEFLRVTGHQGDDDVIKTTPPRPTAGAARPEASRTDEDGVFSMTLTPLVRHVVTVEKAGVGRGRVVLRPECGVGTVRLVLEAATLRSVSGTSRVPEEPSMKH